MRLTALVHSVEKVLNLNAADRRTVHKFAEDYSDIKTFSTGEGKERVLHIAKKEDQKPGVRKGSFLVFLNQNGYAKILLNGEGEIFFSKP